MANTPQAKRIRRNEKRAEINGARMSRIRNFLKKVETAIEGGDKDSAQTALRGPSPNWLKVLPAACCTRTPRRASGRRRLSKRVAAL